MKIPFLGLAFLFLAFVATCRPSISTETQEHYSPTNGTTNSTTTQSIPEPTQPELIKYTESELEIDDCTCFVKETESCTSLQEAIFAIYSEASVEHDTPYSFFTLKDLYYSEILDSRDIGILEPPPLHGIDFSSESELRLTRERCEDLLGRYNLPTKDTKDCRWSYRCTQNQLHFPSFHIEAVLDAESTGVCSRVFMDNWRLYRTKCKMNENLPHWLQCDCGRTVTGYKLDA